MKPETVKFLRSRFKEYYLLESLEMPPQLEQREWGFILFDDMPKFVMRRHKSFMTRSELVDYVRTSVPAHAYHSAALYERPGAPSMREKEWLGADLIFDLDADHLRNAPSSYAEMLDLVKTETIKLLEFLLDDFGFADDEVRVVFSGGRGYHIHVRDSRVLDLGSGERREIVDYLTGRGLDINRFISEGQAEGDFGVETADVIKCCPANSPGWGKTVNRSMISFVEQMRNLDEKEAVKMLSTVEGIGKRNASKFRRSMMRDDILERIRKGESLDLFKGSSKVWKPLIEGYLEEVGVHLGFSRDLESGETDEPVTTDIKRLIRFPLSLHGGTGLRVTPLSVEGLEAFDPLRDAVVFGDRPVEVCLRVPYALEMQGENFDLEEGPANVPLCVAVFLMARKIAELGKALDR
ncbi:MAG TPA: DNA primase small subunit PriS [Methanotrichaceae archaeon]|nr:DNA primase small subunit PriS [Methanotrichaceae archaeon]